VNTTLKQVILACIISILAFGLGSTACPRTKEVKKEVPKIVTQHDTVEKTPKWLDDSVKKWKKKVYTTDTVPLVITNTIVDTEYVPVNSPPEQRPDIWPVLSINGGRIWGDTTIIRTFSIKNGHESVSRLFTTGYITDLEIESSPNPTPRITFTPFPPSEKHGFWHNPKIFGYGFLTGVGVITVLSVVK